MTSRSMKHPRTTLGEVSWKNQVRLYAKNECCRSGNLHWPCRDCGRNVEELQEYGFMLKPEIWKRSSRVKASTYPLPPKDTFTVKIPEKDKPIFDFSCIECVEKRLQRQLVPSDFLDLPISRDPYIPRSVLLKDRMGYTKSWNYKVWNEKGILFYITSDHKLTRYEKMDRIGSTGADPHAHCTLVDKVPSAVLKSWRQELLDSINEMNRQICRIHEIPMESLDGH